MESTDKFPQMLMITKERTHVYEGPIEAEKIFNEFISDQKYLDFKVQGGKGYTTCRLIQEG